MNTPSVMRTQTSLYKSQSLTDWSLLLKNERPNVRLKILEQRFLQNNKRGFLNVPNICRYHYRLFVYSFLVVYLAVVLFVKNVTALTNQISNCCSRFVFNILSYEVDWTAFLFPSTNTV